MAIQLPYDDVTKAVAQAVIRYLPEATATVAQAVVQHVPEANETEAYYHLVMRHLAEVLWQLGSGHLALKALSEVHRTISRQLRPLVIDAPARPER
jgi:hypothetical protein